MYVTEGTTRATQQLTKKTSKKGVIAQLGERLPCTQEVCGSIPHSSTKLRSLNLKTYSLAVASFDVLKSNYTILYFLDAALLLRNYKRYGE